MLNPQPTPFCTVKPESGCIPVGGIVNLELSFFSVDIEKFDFRIDVKVRIIIVDKIFISLGLDRQI